mgnify:FL=1
MDRLAQSAMDAVSDGRVRIVPERYARGYLDWLSEKRDWPVSRQLWWGHQIPIWFAPDVDEHKLRKVWGDREDITWVRDDSLGQWLICSREEDLSEDALPGHKLRREEDVLDTWFSSALWPHSTLGWPEQTPELEYYYPTSVLITSRDIITLWVARMVLTGLLNVGDVPFRDVFIHPKILDGYGETMSKSKGNGVDPLDVIEKFGADALRFGLAYLTTETQDVRMPVEFECPHCQKLVEQTRSNRTRPRVKCTHCKQEFSTQWASQPADQALPRAAVVSERFELARNFCNKLWNASRFALINLTDYTPAAVAQRDLAVEDRWIISRLATVGRQVTEALESYRYGDAARTLYDFAWNEFCSFYVEMAKARLSDPASRPVAQRVLVDTLDTLLRLLHPFVPFITEDVWQRLAQIAPERGRHAPGVAATSVMIAPWPESNPADVDPQIEERFARFEQMLRKLRDIRSQHNIPPKQPVEFVVRTRAATADLLRPMEPYFQSLAGASARQWSEQPDVPAQNAPITLPGIDVFVDLTGLIDLESERQRRRKELDKVVGWIAGKHKKLANANFVERAPDDVVQRERDSLAELEQQQAKLQAELEALDKQG